MLISRVLYTNTLSLKLEHNMKKTKIRNKRKGVALEMRTFHGSDGNTYLVFRTPKGAFHTFVETEAKQASRTCGTTRSAGSTRQLWSVLWKE